MEYVEKSNSYVYVYLDHTIPGPFEYDDGKYKFDYLPIYVGEGQNCRSQDHLKESRRLVKKGAHLTKTLLQRIKNIEETTGFPPKVIKIWENITKDEALHEERLLIKAVKTQRDGGPLYNKMCSDILYWKPPIKNLEGKMYMLFHPYVSSSPIACSHYGELKRFCKQANLDIKKMLALTQKKISNYDGWTVDII